MADNQEEEVADYQDEDEYYGATGGTEQEGTDTLENGDFDQSVLEMDAELEKLNKMQQQVQKDIHSTSDTIDETSIYVGQVDYAATPEELRAHFAPCGTINRITIMCDKATGHPKGFAYVEFVDKESVENALKLDDSTFKGRQLKVLPKRQNQPSTFVRGGGGRFAYRGGRGGAGPAFGGRGRGGRFPPGGRGAGGYYRGGGGGGRFAGRGDGSYAAPAGGRGRGFRGGRAGYTPYY